MPSILYENTVSGVGYAALGSNTVFYLAWNVTFLGNRVRQPTESDSEHVNGVGFLSLGNDLTALGSISGIGWGPEMWLNWTIGQFVAPPGIVGSAFSAWIADHVRWSLGAGTFVHFYVFGE
jgi:hypothetical protein